jgi:hypothetical protein
MGVSLLDVDAELSSLLSQDRYSRARADLHVTIVRLRRGASRSR